MRERRYFYDHCFNRYPVFTFCSVSSHFSRSHHVRREIKELLTRAIGQAEEDTELQATLKDALKLINSRQKLIRIADTSQYGWATVSEYEAHEVATDEDDDNKITRAENRAGRKVKQKKIATANQAKKFKRDPSPSADGPDPGAQFFRRPIQVVPVGHASTRAYSGGSCFICGSFAHWKSTCPKRRTATAASTASSSQ